MGVNAATPDNAGYHSHVRADVIPYIPRSEGLLLDVGGGTGETALRARELGLAARVGVVDRVKPAQSVDFAYCGDLDDPTVFDKLEGDVGKFATILCLDVLEHLVDPWSVVRRLHAMLSPGGVIVASIPNVRHHSVVLPLLLRSSWELKEAGVLDRTHLRFFTRRSACELMTSSGLSLDLVAPLMDGGKATKLLGWNPLSGIRDFAVMQYLVRVTQRGGEAG